MWYNPQQKDRIVRKVWTSPPQSWQTGTKQSVTVSPAALVDRDKQAESAVNVRNAGRGTEKMRKMNRVSRVGSMETEHEKKIAEG
jgi:hypothetical protein